MDQETTSGSIFPPGVNQHLGVCQNLVDLFFIYFSPFFLYLLFPVAMGKDVKPLKMILTSEWHAKHPFAGQTTHQQLLPWKMDQEVFFSWIKKFFLSQINWIAFDLNFWSENKVFKICKLSMLNVWLLKK